MTLFKTSLFVFDRLDSTNDFLFQADLEEYPLGTAVLALSQSDGKGRSGRTWQSGVGGMYLSIVFKPSYLDGLTLLGAYCVIRLCREQFGLKTELRWPNDVYVGERKLSGVLPRVKFLGSVVERAVLGVGLNVCQSLESFPSELSGRVATLSHLTGESLHVESVAHRFLAVFEEEWARYESVGCPGLVELCQPYLQGCGCRAIAAGPAGARRELGVIDRLGSRGELLFQDGSALENLGVEERLQVLSLHVERS